MRIDTKPVAAKVSRLILLYYSFFLAKGKKSSGRNPSVSLSWRTYDQKVEEVSVKGKQG